MYTSADQLITFMSPLYSTTGIIITLFFAFCIFNLHQISYAMTILIEKYRIKGHEQKAHNNNNNLKR